MKRRKLATKALSWGPDSYIPFDVERVSKALNLRGLFIIAGSADLGGCVGRLRLSYSPLVTAAVAVAIHPIAALAKPAPSARRVARHGLAPRSEQRDGKGCQEARACRSPSRCAKDGVTPSGRMSHRGLHAAHCRAVRSEPVPPTTSAGTTRNPDSLVAFALAPTSAFDMDFRHLPLHRKATWSPGQPKRAIVSLDGLPLKRDALRLADGPAGRPAPGPLGKPGFSLRFRNAVPESSVQPVRCPERSGSQVPTGEYSAAWASPGYQPSQLVISRRSPPAEDFRLLPLCP